MLKSAFSLFGQVVVYGLIALVLAYFSTSPGFQVFPPQKSRILLDFSHVGARKGECRQLSKQEIAEMAANMRRSEICPRERLPIVVEVELDGEQLVHRSLPPSGLSGDSASQIYQGFEVAPGARRIVARLRDSRRESGFDYESEIDVELRPRENFVIDFRSELGGFIFGAGRLASTQDRN